MSIKVGDLLQLTLCNIVYGNNEWDIYFWKPGADHNNVFKVNHSLTLLKKKHDLIPGKGDLTDHSYSNEILLNTLFSVTVRPPLSFSRFVINVKK